MMNREMLRTKWNEAISYAKYKDLIDDLVMKGMTTGANQSEAMVNYTRINAQRMKRLEKHTRLGTDLVSELKNLSGNYGWLILTEPWCGDAANNIPILKKMAEQTPNISLRLILRDEYPELMDEFLTEGSRGIPKLIALNLDTFDVVGSWGPRPEPAQKIMRQYKADENMSYEEVAESIQQWYLKDKSQTMQAEFKILLPLWEAKIFSSLTLEN